MEEASELPKLSTKQKLFVEAYLTCANGTQAAIRAGYSRKTAASIASENLRKPEIRAHIDARLAEAKAGADEVIAVLTDQMYGTMGDFLIVDKKGNTTVSFTPERLHLIRKLKQSWRTIEADGEIATEESVEIELHDSQAAAVQLGRYHKLFTDNKAVSGDINVNWVDALDDDDDIGLGADQLPDAGETA